MTTPILLHYINSEVQSSDAAIRRIELPNKGALHAAIVKVKCTNGATGGRAKNIFTDVLDKIEIRGDSSKILLSQYPKDFEKWFETLNGEGMQIVENQGADAVQEAVFPIMFGREIYDPEMFLPLSHWDDVKLELEFSPTIAADSGFATGTVTFDVMLLMTMEDANLPYQGTLITRTMKEHTTVVSGVEEFELPGDSLIRMIGNYVYEAGIADGVDVTKIELKDKSSGNSLFVADWAEFIAFNRQLFGADITHYAELFLTDNEVWASRIGEILNLSVEMEETVDTTNDEVDFVNVDAIAGDTLTFDVFNVDITAASETMTASSTDRAIRVAATGKSPSCFGLIPFNYVDTPDNYLRTSDWGRLIIEYTQGGAGGQLYTTIQEFETL